MSNEGVDLMTLSEANDYFQNKLGSFYRVTCKLFDDGDEYGVGIRFTHKDKLYRYCSRSKVLLNTNGKLCIKRIDAEEMANCLFKYKDDIEERDYDNT